LRSRFAGRGRAEAAEKTNEATDARESSRLALVAFGKSGKILPEMSADAAKSPENSCGRAPISTGTATGAAPFSRSRTAS
jgi:hypothetical protein